MILQTPPVVPVIGGSSGAYVARRCPNAHDGEAPLRRHVALRRYPRTRVTTSPESDPSPSYTSGPAAPALQDHPAGAARSPRGRSVSSCVESGGGCGEVDPDGVLGCGCSGWGVEAFGVCVCVGLQGVVAAFPGVFPGAVVDLGGCE